MSYFPITLPNGLILTPLRQADAPIFFQTLQDNRAHLDRWLRWSGWVQTLEDAEALIGRFEAKLEARDGFHAGIWEGQNLLGGLVCHGINRNSQKSEIGYWLVAGQVGRGLASEAAQAVIRHLFTDERLNRIEILCATDNLRSRAIPERLGFTQEGILRESDWLTTRFADHAMYSLLRREWEAQGSQAG